jgi:hypothetical protein
MEYSVRTLAMLARRIAMNGYFVYFKPSPIALCPPGGAFGIAIGEFRSHIGDIFGFLLPPAPLR